MFVKGFFRIPSEKVGYPWRKHIVTYAHAEAAEPPTVRTTLLVSLGECLPPLDHISITPYLTFDKMVYCTRLNIKNCLFCAI